MCGIIGFARDFQCQEHHIDLMSALVRESSIRGLHAFGYSYHNSVVGGDIVTVKQFDLPNAYDLGVAMMRGDVFLYHNRYSTSGNWEDHNNNMPISNGHLSLAANCVISQKTKPEYEQEFGISCVTENDAEILWQILWYGRERVDDFLRKITGSFAGVWINRGKLWFLRNNKRPLHYFVFDGALFVVSTYDIAYRALQHIGQVGMGKSNVDIKLVEPFVVHTS